MADTQQLLPAMLALMPSGVPNAISATILRQLAISSFNIVPTPVSAAGTTQGSATALTTHTNVVTVCASGAGVVLTLPFHKVYSRGAAAVLVYPASGAQFEAFGTNLPVSIPVGDQAEFYMTSTTQGWVG
jgi:hypothetical protein